LTHLRHGIFSEGCIILLLDMRFVNEEDKITWRVKKDYSKPWPQMSERLSGRRWLEQSGVGRGSWKSYDDLGDASRRRRSWQ
jgi:hypothetical protein